MTPYVLLVKLEFTEPDNTIWPVCDSATAVLLAENCTPSAIDTEPPEIEMALLSACTLAVSRTNKLPPLTWSCELGEMNTCEPPPNTRLPCATTICELDSAETLLFPEIVMSPPFT